MPDQTAIPRWEQFQHGADSGIRGIGATKAQAFEQAALALSGVISAPQKIRALNAVDIHCDSDDDEVLLLDGLTSYKDVAEAVDSADKAELARTVARLEPGICIKG